MSAAEILGKALNFVLMAVPARQLTPEDFGGYTTVLSLVWSDILILGQTRSMDDVAVYGTAQKVAARRERS